MFAVATNFNKDISAWNVSSGTNFVSGVNQKHFVISSLGCDAGGTMVLAVMMDAAFLAPTINKQEVAAMLKKSCITRTARKKV
jgi:hypothetical protein